MSTDQENFESLRCLLSLKRHEAPPPGYFDRFSREVIERIKSGERGAGFAPLERMLWEAPWLQRFWAAIEAKPVLAGACSVAMCGLLIAGVIYSDKAEIPPVGLVPVAETGSAPMAPTAMAAADHPLLAKPAVFPETSSTSPIPNGPAGTSLMGDIGQLRAQPASFSFPRGN
ncbi:MAG TPA: hypothetical protein P5205_12495 [Candidatus Paceibacterota bacterium]|nr:hypothetical protein [Verrucomicrobiota bacterium]HSA11180.1 hypothetical protein [Candidatus Paceibacterota bacterium]